MRQNKDRVLKRRFGYYRMVQGVKLLVDRKETVVVVFDSFDLLVAFGALPEYFACLVLKRVGCDVTGSCDAAT